MHINKLIVQTSRPQAVKVNMTNLSKLSEGFSLAFKTWPPTSTLPTEEKLRHKSQVS